MYKVRIKALLFIKAYDNIYPLNALIRTVGIKAPARESRVRWKRLQAIYVENHLGAALITPVDYVIIINKRPCLQGN